MSDRGSSITVYGINPDLWHCHLDNFVWDNFGVNVSESRAAVEEYIEQVCACAEGKGPPATLILLGEPGRGKSHLGVSLYRLLVFRFSLAQVFWRYVPEYLQAIKAGFDSGEDAFRELAEAKFFVGLDDILGRELTPWESSFAIPRMITTAYANRASLLITDNHPLDQIKARLSPHEYDRLTSRATVLHFSGQSLR